MAREFQRKPIIMHSLAARREDKPTLPEYEPQRHPSSSRSVGSCITLTCYDVWPGRLLLAGRA